MRRLCEALIALVVGLTIGVEGGQAHARLGGDEADQTGWVVEGRVSDVHSRWDAEHSLIYSRAEIQVVAAWEDAGQAADVSVEVDETGRVVSEAITRGTGSRRLSPAVGKTVTVVFEGGQVDGEALYVSDSVSLAVGQRVRLRLAPQPTGEYRIVGGASGAAILDGEGKATRLDQALPSPARRWERDRLPVPYLINASALDVAGAEDAVRAAFATWQEVDCSYMAYTYQGVTERTGGGRDGYNTISWGQTDGALAKIRWWVDASGLLTEFDIIFAEDRRWGVDGAADRFDIQNAATHEAGHILVLDDLYDPTAAERVMYGYIRKGETHKRALHRDDIASICALYPRSELWSGVYLPLVGR
jgi:hypothetical protein